MKNWSEQRKFVYIALIFGFLFIFLTPPFQSPDEDSHFKKTYLVSRGVLYPKTSNQKTGNEFPTEMLNYINEKLGYIGNRNKKYKYSELVLDQYSNMNYNDKTFNEYSTSNVLFFAYIPASIGIIFSKICAKIFNMDMVSVPYMLYFARVFSLLFSIFITYQAIKTTPVLKKGMLVVSLMPMSLFLMGMITYDNIINSISLFTVAYILKLIYDEKIERISKKNIITLILLAFILFNYKIVYCTLFILLLFIPKQKFKNIKNMIINFSIIGISVIGLTLLFQLPFSFLPKIVDGSQKLVNDQRQFVIKNLFTFIHIVLRNIIDQRAFQLTSMVGLFGLLDTYIPLPIVALYLTLLLFIGLTENTDDKYKITIKMKIFLALSICMTIFGIFGAMYISWTPKVVGKVGTYDLTGVQGRYFIPLLFPILLILSNKKIKGKYINVLKENYIIFIICPLILSTATILLRYWI